jgi:hypothetical protein
MPIATQCSKCSGQGTLKRVTAMLGHERLVLAEIHCAACGRTWEVTVLLFGLFVDLVVRPVVGAVAAEHLQSNRHRLAGNRSDALGSSGVLLAGRAFRRVRLRTRFGPFVRHGIASLSGNAYVGLSAAFRRDFPFVRAGRAANAHEKFEMPVGHGADLPARSGAAAFWANDRGWPMPCPWLVFHAVTVSERVRLACAIQHIAADARRGNPVLVPDA